MNIKVAEVNLPTPINRLSNRALSIVFFAIRLVGISLYLVPAICATVALDSKMQSEV